MRELLKYFSFFVLCLVCLTCKKKTTIKVTVFNYALNEPIADAKVVLVKRKLSSFGASYSCEEIDSKTTDAKGQCSFDREKLRTGSSYQYYFGISSAYGIQQTYPCGGKTSGFIKVGETQEQMLNVNEFDANFRVQLNNFLIPSMVNDSFDVRVNSPMYEVPNQPYAFGGGGVFSKSGYQWGGGNPSPVVLSDFIKTNAGKNTVHIRKRKLGVVTTSIDTVKIYPNETKIIEINW